MDIEKPADEVPAEKPSRYHPSLKPYIRQVADLLRLKDWTIVLDEAEVADVVSMGEIECIWGRKVAYVKFNRERWPRYTKDQKRHTIVHELLHCHAEGLLDFVRMGVTGELSQSAANIFRAGVRQNAEYMVDGMTDVVAEFMPEYPDE